MSTIWGSTKKYRASELRGMVGLDPTPCPPSRRADVIVRGQGERFAYEVVLPGGRSAKSLYVFFSQDEAQAEAESIALALLLTLNPEARS